MMSIRFYVDDHGTHAKMTFLATITAVTWKAVILDACRIEPLILFGIGFLAFTLSAGYERVKRNSPSLRGGS
jgi:hypothetical protein